MIIEHMEALQAWLAKVLVPLCDADPIALAKYVIARIKKDKTEEQLRQGMIDQLDAFLQAETRPFVDRVFEALNTKEYLDSMTTPPDSPIPPSKSTSPKDESSVSSSGGSVEDMADSDSPCSSLSGGVKEIEDKPDEIETPSSTSDVTSTVSTTNSNVNPSPTATPAADEGGSLCSSSKEQLSTTPPAPLSTEAASSGNSSNANNDSSKDTVTQKSKRERSEDDRDKRRTCTRTERDKRSSLSSDRSKRSRSPMRRQLARERRGRPRYRVVRSPPRLRYRRRSRSPIHRNRSPSPRNRSRTPLRYRRPFNASRSRSRSLSVPKDKKDPVLLPPVQDLKDKSDKPTVQSVVVIPGAAQQQGDSSAELKQGYTTGQGTEKGNRCRDFDEKGLCMRGELCPFDHGKDPVVLEDIIVPGVGPSAPGFGRGLVPVPGAPGYCGPLRPDEYYPENPSFDPPLGWRPGAPPFRPRLLGRGRGGLLLRPGMGPFQMPGQRQLVIGVPVGVPLPVSMMGNMRGSHPPISPMHPVRCSHPRGRGRFDYGRLGSKPTVNYTNCSLEVRKIPRAQNTIFELNRHFLRFGKIINIQINYDNDPEGALVTFSSPSEAQLAYRSTEAVLNNRFIRVFWHNKEEENEKEAEASAAGAGSNPLRVSVKDRLGAQQEPPTEHEKILLSGNNLTKTVYNNAALLTKKMETPQDKLQTVESIKRSQEMLAAQVSLKNLQEQKKQEALQMSNDLRKRQQTIMEEQINQQKKLIAKLESGKLKPEEREETLKILKVLEESVSKLKRDLDESNPKIIKKPVFQGPRSKEEAQKEMLDAELDLYHKEQQGGDTIDLQKKVLELRAHAKSLGLIGSRGGRATFRGMGRGGFRGGRGIMRGRGRGSVRASRSVDRRPTKIRITGCPANKFPELLSHFSVFGNIRDYESDSNVPMMIVDFDSRKCAEVAMSNGQLFDHVKLTLEWVTEANLEAKVIQLESTNNGDASNHDDLDNTEDKPDEIETPSSTSDVTSAKSSTNDNPSSTDTPAADEGGSLCSSSKEELSTTPSAPLSTEAASSGNSSNANNDWAELGVELQDRFSFKRPLTG